MTAHAWSLEPDLAEARSGDWTIRLCPTRPGDGVEVKSSSGSSWNIFRCQALPRHRLLVEEAYVRDQDLITRFSQSAEDEFAFQLNYRLLPTTASDLLGLELWVSVQTRELDAQPCMSIASRSAGGQYWKCLNHGQAMQDESIEAAESSPAALVCLSNEFSGLWLVEFGDQRQADWISSPAEEEQRIDLFGQFMEKGVIRRARMRFHCMPGEVSPEVIRSLYEDFIRSPLPLTA